MLRLDNTIPETLDGKRFDSALAALFPEYSREFLKSTIIDQKALLDGKPAKPKDKVKSGQIVTVETELPERIESKPQDIPLDILHEDDHLMVINKAANFVVHPGAGVHNNTLMNALLHHHEGAKNLPRAGIIHRLDKDTTGLLVVAKTLEAHHALVDALQERAIKREYLALVYGELTGGGTINAPIGRDPKNRVKMGVVKNGKEAVTHFRIHERYTGCTLLHVQLETGRTHQIRVHLASIHHPIVGDPVYTGRKKAAKGFNESFHRQALHAWQLTLTHPVSKEVMTFKAPLPQDFETLLDAIKEA